MFYSKSCMFVNMLTYLGANNSRSLDIMRAATYRQTVLLPCRLPNTSYKVWRYYRDTNRRHGHHDHGHHNITHNGVVTSNFEGRFQLDAEGLLINDVQTTDQGTYTCGDQHHRHHRLRIRLFVPCALASYCS